MNFKKNFFTLYSFCLFLFVFIYLLLRAFYNEPLHDEIATYFNFIETGKIFGDHVIQDAQNHLLNSYCSRIMYLLLGDHIFALRIPNLIAFTIYFYGIFRLSSLLKERLHQILLLTSLSTLSFIIEYFAYSRGYGIGMAFFVWILIYSIEWMKNPQLKTAFYLYFFAYMTIFANLIFFGSSFLAMFLLVLFHLKNIRLFSFKKNALLIGLHFCFLLSIFPFIWLTYLLKNGGALYHGSKNGLWEVTGKTLSKITFFYDADWQKYIILGGIILAVFILLYLAKKKGFWNQLKEKESIIAYYFLGNLFIILVLAKFLNVNYPEDRVGMYLIVLFIVLFSYLIIKFNSTKSILFVLLFFPISFIWKMNLHSSIYSQDNRLTADFYNQVQKSVTPDLTVGVDPIMSLCWAYHERKQKRIKINIDLVRGFNSNYDIQISKINQIKSTDNLTDYSVIALDKTNQIIAYKRKSKINKKKVVDEKIQTTHSRKKQISLLTINDLDDLKNKSLLLHFSGDFELDKSFDNLQVDFEIINEKNEKTCYQTFNQRWILGQGKLQFSLNINTIIKQLKENDKKLTVIIWNPQGRLITFKNGITKLYEIKP